MIPQMAHKTTRCHRWAAIPISRTSNVRAESFPNVDDTTDRAGAITVYLIALARSSLLWIESLERPRPNLVPTVTSAEHTIADIWKTQVSRVGDWNEGDGLRTVPKTLKKSSQPACPTMVHRTQIRAVLMQIIVAPRVHETMRSVLASLLGSAIMGNQQKARILWDFKFMTKGN